MFHSIDFYSIRFWCFVGVAVFLMGAIRSPRARQRTFALLNLAFLAMHLPPRPWLLTIGAVVAAWLLLRLAETRPLRAWALACGGATVAALFLVHKLPRLAARWDAEGLDRTLAIVGFSYVALRLFDVARAVGQGDRRAPDLTATLNYLLPFHMLSAGPIQAYTEFADQPAEPAPLDLRGALGALERIAAGLTKKFVLANLIQSVFLTHFSSYSHYFFIEIQWQFVWLYLDFSAYSDVAVGIGRLMGVATPENFNRPLLARNVLDFWERWHISLSHFLRRNVFIPLQLALTRRTDARRPLACVCVAYVVTFGLCGLWHGLDVHWLAWGLYEAAGMTACSLYKHWLVSRLGRKGVKRYVENRWVRALAILATFEFTALSMAVIMFPIRDFLEWNRYHSLWNP